MKFMFGAKCSLTRFGKCLLTSTVIHAMVIGLLFQRPFWFSSLWHSFLGKITSSTVDLPFSSGDEESALDSAFEVFLTEKPASKPYDLPRLGSKKPALTPRDEYSASPIKWSDPLSNRPKSEWLTETFEPYEFNEPTVTTSLATLPIPIVEHSEPQSSSTPDAFIFVTHSPADDEERDSAHGQTAKATQEEALDLSPKTHKEISSVAVTPIFSKSHHEAESLSVLPPKLDTLEVPTVNAFVSIPLAPPQYAVVHQELFPDLSLIAAIASIDPEKAKGFNPALEGNSGACEMLAASAAKSPSSFSNEIETAAHTSMQKPLLSTSTILQEDVLSYVPNTAAPKEPTLPSLKDYGLPNVSSVAGWHNLFSADVRVMPRKKEEDLLFSIELTPKKEAIAYALRQNFHFVINCSSDMPKHRIPVYKKAVHRALGHLNSGQNFNIYFVHPNGAVYDSEMLEANEKEIAKAREFLDREDYKSEKRKTSLLGVLHQIAAMPKAHNELHTVILLSDGHVIDKKRKREDELRSWLNAQKGKIALYAATVGESNRSMDLELFAATSGSQVLISPTHAAFARKFTKMVMDLQYPLATDVTIALRSKLQDFPLYLASISTSNPPLFASQSCTIVGSAPKAVDFTLMIEGNGGGRFVEISKHLSLKAAPRPAFSLASLWLEKSAHEELAQFLESGGQFYLEEAAKLLGKADDK